METISKTEKKTRGAERREQREVRSQGENEVDKNNAKNHCNTEATRMDKRSAKCYENSSYCHYGPKGTTVVVRQYTNY
jgi:hypothetical protein